MTADEARELVIEGINYAAYRETDSSLHDADKNRLWGSERYGSGRNVVKPSPWAEGDFEEKMATLLRWARSTDPYLHSQRLRRLCRMRIRSSVVSCGMLINGEIDACMLCSTEEEGEMAQFTRITQDPGVMGGKACIRGMRVTVGMIVAQIGAGHTIDEILADYPYIEREDVLQALRYAAWLAEDREVVLPGT